MEIGRRGIEGYIPPLFVNERDVLYDPHFSISLFVFMQLLLTFIFFSNGKVLLSEYPDVSGLISLIHVHY